MNKIPSFDATTIFYNENAKKFADRTFDLDMDSLYAPFLKYLCINGRVLDAGCGSGRDAKNFADKGFSVTAFDASKELVEIAKEKTGLAVELLRFQDLSWSDEFDGIWACASLLHVPESDMIDVFRRLETSLKDKGIIFVSFKYGDLELVRNGRLFSNYDEKKLGKLIDKFDNLHITEQWITTDLRPGREEEKWLNAVIKKG